MGKITLLILSLPAHIIPPAGYWDARLARQPFFKMLSLPASAPLSGIIAGRARSLLGQAVCQMALWHGHLARSCVIIIRRLAVSSALCPQVFEPRSRALSRLLVGSVHSSLPNISCSGQRLRRFFAERGLPEFAQSFRRVSPVPPLPLTQTVRQFLYVHAFENRGICKP